jgi:hypothetical protein
LSTGGGSSSRSARSDAEQNPRYFGQRRGITWLNAINDRVAGIGGAVDTTPDLRPLRHLSAADEQ